MFKTKFAITSVVFASGFFISILPVFASTVTYTPSNLSLDTDSSIYGNSNLLVSSGNLYLNWNRPAVDSNYVGYWRFNEGAGTSVGDDSTQANAGTLTGSGTNVSPSWVSSVNAFAGNSALTFGANKKVVVGSVLNYEKTQPWTVIAAIKMSSAPASAAIIFSNVNASPYPGYEFWVNSSGQLQVRIISSIFGQYIGVIGTTNVADNQWHVVSASYDGSSTAAGVKIYLDGNPESTTVESDNLTTGSIVSTGPFVIGNQTGFESSYYMRGSIDEFSLSNIARSPSYISQHSSSSTLPSVDANMVLDYHFDEGSGTTVRDSSSNNYTATLSGNYPFWDSLPAWQGTSTLYYDGTDVYASMPSISAYNLGSQFTLTSWADSLVSPGAGTLFYKIGASPFPGWAFLLGYSNTMQWWDSVAFRNSTVAAATGWHQYALRFNSGTLDFIVDGSIVKTLTGVSTPSTAVSQALLIGDWPGLGGGQWNGYISNTTISNIARSDGYLSSFATRYAPAGTASLSSVSTNISSGGGNFGSTASITQLAATFNKPSSTNVQFRLGTGSSPAAATADKQAQSFSTLNSTNTLNKTGQYIDYDIKLISSTDSLAQNTPSVTSLTVTYAVDTTPPAVSITAPISNAIVSGSSVMLTATSSDNIAVSSVQFKVDGTNIGISGTSTPYSITWDSTSVADGSHTLNAVAEDTSGNYATSSISVTVHNAVSAPPVTSVGGNGPISGPLSVGYQNTTPTQISTLIPSIPIIPPIPTSTTISLPPASLVVLAKNRQLGNVGADIKTLQKFLNSHGFIVARTGYGSSGKETDTFGPLTYKALKAFQKATGLPQTGYLGPLTRAEILVFANN